MGRISCEFLNIKVCVKMSNTVIPIQVINAYITTVGVVITLHGDFVIGQIN